MRCDEILFPALAAWEINTECNHKCTYCYNYRCVSNRQKVYSEEKMDQISDFIIQHKPLGVFISGGEPLLLYPLLAKQIVKFKEAGIYVSIYTNASLIDENIAKFLGEMKVRVMVSFPSVYEKEFAKTVTSSATYDHVITGLKLLKKYNVRIEPNIVVTKINHSSVEDTIEFLYQEFSPRKIFISRATRPSNADTEYTDIALSRAELNAIFDRCAELSLKYGIDMGTCGGFAPCIFDKPETRQIFGKLCSFGINGYAITANGDVKICVREDNSYGNIFLDPFEKIRSNMCEWWNMPIPKECRGCGYHIQCRGGCKLAVKDEDQGLAYIDCDACTEAGKKIHIPVHRKKNYLLKDMFSVKQIVFLEEKHMTRVSIGLKYLYLNKKAAEFLKSTASFSVIGLCIHGRLSYRQACTIIENLLAYGMVEKNEK